MKTMKRLIFSLLCVIFPASVVFAQNDKACNTSSGVIAIDEDSVECDSAICEEEVACIFNGEYESEQTGLRLHLNLDEESINIPGMSFLGATNGYLDGKTNNHVYGVWMLLKFELSDDEKMVKLRFSNDIGSDSQDVLLTLIDSNTLKYEAIGGNSIRKVEGGRKLVKIPSSMILKRKE